MRDVINHPYPDIVEVRAWMSNYIPLFYMDAITLGPNPAAGLANLS